MMLTTVDFFLYGDHRKTGLRFVSRTETSLRSNRLLNKLEGLDGVPFAFDPRNQAGELIAIERGRGYL